MSASIYLSREEHSVMLRMTVSRTCLGEEKVIDWQVPISRAWRRISKLGFVSDIRKHRTWGSGTLYFAWHKKNRTSIRQEQLVRVSRMFWIHIYVGVYWLAMNVNDKTLDSRVLLSIWFGHNNHLFWWSSSQSRKELVALSWSIIQPGISQDTTKVVDIYGGKHHHFDMVDILCKYHAGLWRYSSIMYIDCMIYNGKL